MAEFVADELDFVLANFAQDLDDARSVAADALVDFESLLDLFRARRAVERDAQGESVFEALSTALSLVYSMRDEYMLDPDLDEHSGLDVRGSMG